MCGIKCVRWGGGLLKRIATGARYRLLSPHPETTVRRELSERLARLFQSRQRRGRPDRTRPYDQAKP